MTVSTEHEPSTTGGAATEAAPPRAGGGWGGVLVGLVVLLVLAFLGLLGYKLAATEGWFRGGQGGVSGGAPGIFTSGQLVKTAFTQAPDFSVSLFSGGSLRLADLRGQPVMVNFWASWCPPCREEAPLLERTWREYRDKGVVFVGLDIWDTEQDARGFLRQFDITYPTGPDDGGRTAIDYGLTGIPETFFIDRQGRVAHKWIGPFTEPALRGFLDEVIASEG